MKNLATLVIAMIVRKIGRKEMRDERNPIDEERQQRHNDIQWLKRNRPLDYDREVMKLKPKKKD